jgi:putative mRNA 3-end processing factor
MSELIEPRDNGYYCSEGDFYLDPETAVSTAVVSHGHADHGARQSNSVHCTSRTKAVLDARYDISSTGHAYGERFDVNGVSVELFPANHVFGSALVRVSHGGEQWLYTGDYKAADDPTTEALHPVSCDVLITETTFALPVYQWRPPEEVIEDVVRWLRSADDTTTTILYAYSLGKAQRILAELAEHDKPDVYVHRSVAAMNTVYDDHGVRLGDWTKADLRTDDYKTNLLVAPQGVRESHAIQRLDDKETAMVSGWMRVRGNRRWRNYDRGFPLSDHCDWDGLVSFVDACDPDEVKTVHGQTEVFAEYLNRSGVEAEAWE